MSSEPELHGGDLAGARALFPQAPADWLDLSTGINAEPYPVGEISPAAWTRLPEPAAIAALEAAAASAYGARAESVVAAPGTQALIQLLPRLIPARSVAILDFTYAEHGRAWRAAGAEVTTVGRLDDLAAADVAIVVNPNNPDGRLVEAEALAELARARRGGALIVDEAFIDLYPRAAGLAPRLPERGVVALRSFGKTYGLAGLRLGFAIASSDLAPRLRDGLGPWAVSGAAIEIGARALADAPWLAATARRLQAASERLDARLSAHGFTILGGSPLYRLGRHDDAQAVFRRLGEGGVLVRRFPARPEWLRFGIPAAETDWTRLERAL